MGEGRAVAAVALLLSGALAAAGARSAAAPDSDLCFNQLQVLGSHNSYHQAPPQQLLQAFGSLTSGPLTAWQYSHPPLTAQLDAGVRAFELDVYWDPQGGLYGQAAGLKIVGENGWLPDPRYQQPGFKVLHIPDFDFRSSCLLLTECLAEIKAWSDAHPRHLPILLYLELKAADQLEEGLGEGLLGLLQGLLDAATAEGPDRFVEVPETTPQTFMDLQGELLSVFGGVSSSGNNSSSSSGGHGQLLTPDDVRAALGAAPGADLQQLLLKPPGSQPCPWPSLEGTMRGKVLPILIQRGGGSQAAALQAAYPNLVGSLAWVEQGGRSPLPQAAFRSTAVWRLGSGSALSLDLPANATEMVASLAQLVQQEAAAGFIVRARADADTVEARAGFTARRDAIIAAGAQVVASDFILPAAQHRAQGSSAPLYTGVGATYNVTLPGGLTGHCLRDSTASGSTSSTTSPPADSIPVQQASVNSTGTEEDGVYCGPLETAPPGRAAFTPEGAPAPSPALPADSMQEEAVAGSGTAAAAPGSGGSALADASGSPGTTAGTAAGEPPAPCSSGSCARPAWLAALAAGVAALAAALVA